MSALGASVNKFTGAAILNRGIPAIANRSHSGSGNSEPSDLGNEQPLPQYVSMVGLDWCKGNVASAYRNKDGAPVIQHKTGMDCAAFIRANGRPGLIVLQESSFASGIADGDEFREVCAAARETGSLVKLVSPRATPRRLEKAGHKIKGEPKVKGTDGFDAWVTLLHYEEHPQSFVALDPQKPRREATEEEKALRNVYLQEKASGWKQSMKLVKALPVPEEAPEHVRQLLSRNGTWATAVNQIAVVARGTGNTEHFDRVLGMYENAYPSPYRADMLRRVRWATAPKVMTYKSGARKGQTKAGGLGMPLREARSAVRRASRWVRTQVCGGGKTESGVSATFNRSQGGQQESGLGQPQSPPTETSNDKKE